MGVCSCTADGAHSHGRNPKLLGRTELSLQLKPEALKAQSPKPSPHSNPESISSPLIHPKSQQPNCRKRSPTIPRPSRVPKPFGEGFKSRMSLLWGSGLGDPGLEFRALGVALKLRSCSSRSCSRQWKVEMRVQARLRTKVRKECEDQ